MQIRLVTYNIHKGIGGVDRLYRPERIVAAVEHCAPDILFLQEVDEDVPRSHHDRQVDLLGDALQLPHRVYQANVRLKQGHYGNAILSRYPLTDVEDLDLTVPLKKRRRALVAHCRVRGGDHSRTLLLYNVHLGLAGFERNIQLKRVLASAPLQHTRQDTGVIVAGDYNDVWGTLGRRLLEPQGSRPPVCAAAPFPLSSPCGRWTASTFAACWNWITASPHAPKSHARHPITCRWSSCSESRNWTKVVVPTPRLTQLCERVM